ncbi:MAG: GntR family transcriptional regulator [Firmicutes bacterium]|nr:GntR family transcriptional regulator [Bacillota bacterium]
MVSLRDFVTKNARAAMRIAQDLLEARPGDRLSPVAEYAARLGVGRGTVQAALRLLQDSGAVRLVPRGHMGTFVERVDRAALWSLSGLGTVTGVMPLPYSQRYRGVATGLYQAFHVAQIPLVLAHMRGARRRLEALLTRRYEFALVSKLSYEVARRERGELCLAVDLGPGTNVREHVLLIRGPSDRITDGMRVGVDPDSIDITELTRHECAQVRVTAVEAPYTQFLGLILKGVIDAAVWDSEEGLPPREAGLKVVPLRGRADGTAPDTSAAVLVVHRDNQTLASILRSSVDVAVVRETLDRVMRGEVLPEL